MKTWLRFFSVIGVIFVCVVVATAMLLFPIYEKPCCLCDAFRYHAPCLIDLETGELTELDLYFPHETLVAELAEKQPETSTFSFVDIGNVTGTKNTGSKTVTLHVPNDKTFKPALCSSCRKLLPLIHTGRYVLADLYSKEAVLIPIKPNTAFSLRCYEITTEKNTEKGGISVLIQGALE